MPCEGCNQSGNVILGYSQLIGGGDCQCTNCESGSVVKTSCVYYGGPNLNNTGIETCDDLNTVLSKIDQALSATLGDYSTYNKYCLDDTSAILNEQQFVEAISSYVCTLRSDFDTFVGTTYSGFVNSINSRVSSLEIPGVTCAIAGITDSDGINTIYAKICTTLTNLNSQFSLTGVDWSQEYPTSPAPVNLVQAFNVVIDQIGLVKDLAEQNTSTLPTFNNVGSCLPAPVTATDSLVDTVNKIKTRLCSTPTFDPNNIAFDCIVTGTTLEDSIQNIIAAVSTLSRAAINQVSSDFNLVPIDLGDSCQGYRLELSGSIADTKIALNSSDPNPGTFVDKFAAGVGVTFDYLSQPGKVVISSQAAVTEGIVKSDITDTAPAPLIDKLVASSQVVDGLSIEVTVDLATHKVVITPSLDLATLVSNQLDLIDSNSVLRAKFCELVRSCPSPCEAPSNVEVIYGTTTTTTTTTTTIP